MTPNSGSLLVKVDQSTIAYNTMVIDPASLHSIVPRGRDIM